MNAYNPIGYMPMPAGFPLKDLFLKGRPAHKKYDDFWQKHPPMKPGRRAKIFAPFDALAGFDDAALTRSGKEARKNRPSAAVTFFVPCVDKNSFAYGQEGTYNTITGFVEKVTGYAITIDGQNIPLEDVSDIKS